MGKLHLVTDPQPPRAASRLLEYGAAWREAQEIAEAHRVRVRSAVLDKIDASLSITDAAELTGLSLVTMHHWLRAHRH